jgi:transcriptional regulator with XRE-family HTH domain
MDDVAVGRALRAVRVRKRLRQADVAARAGVSQQAVSRLETGAISAVSIDLLRRVATAIGGRIVVDLRWHGADLDRLLGAKHSAMHEAIAASFAGMPDWMLVPEVSFAVYGERGVIDILAWHAPSHSLLVIEIKTELADMQQTLGTLDRKVRLAPLVARERGWNPATVSAWLVVADASTNRNRVAAHRSMLRNALPASGPELRAWLRRPAGSIRVLSFLAAPQARRAFAQVNRVRGDRGASRVQRPPDGRGAPDRDTHQASAVRQAARR